MDPQMYLSVHLECDGTGVGSMEPRPDKEVQATHVGTMDLTHKSRDHDLCWNQRRIIKKFTSANATQFTAINHARIHLSFSTQWISDSLLDCNSGKYWSMMRKKESDSICPKPSKDSLSIRQLHFSNPFQSLKVKSLVSFNLRKSCIIFILSTFTLVMEWRYSWLEILNVGSSQSLE